MARSTNVDGGAIQKPKAYHHGALREALLDAAETILRRDGIESLTLRAAAREAGVSHAAPKNHFDNLTGLLSDLAARGYERFHAEVMRQDPGRQMRDMGIRYVAFARRNPDLFVLMFRNTRLDYERPALKKAGDAALSGLTGQAGGSETGLRREELAGIAARWALVHGYAMLMIDGRLSALLQQQDQGHGTLDEDGLLDAIMAQRPGNTLDQEE